MSGAMAVLLLAQAAGPAKVVDIGAGAFKVPDGCVHVPGRNIDSARGAFECGSGQSSVRYDIGGRDERGWCTEAPKDSEFPPARVTELRAPDGRRVFVCDLPRFQDEPARLVAVVGPNASFYASGTTPADTTWLLTVALAFRAR